MKKPIICVDTRTEFPSLRCAAQHVLGYESALSAAVAKQNRYRGVYWVFRDLSQTFSDQMDSWKQPESKRKKTRVKNTTTGDIFESVLKAAEHVKVSTSAVSTALKNGGRCKGYQWEVLSEDLYQILK
jgi:hypothetical protein